jgi:hypothetical protein
MAVIEGDGMNGVGTASAGSSAASFNVELVR